MAISESWLTAQISQCRVQPLRFGGQVWLADGNGVLYCPGRDALVVSDLHLEKGSFLGQFANPIPQFDSLATLQRLQSLMHEYLPKTLVCLGDSFHDKHAFARMDDAEKHLLAKLVRQCEQWLWVTGNHDETIDDAAGGEAVSHVQWHDVLLQHEPDSRYQGCQIVGHFHPKHRAVIARRRFQGKCFVHTDSLLVMPAFGQYTGGLSIDSDVLQALLPASQRRVFLNFDDKVYSVR